MNIQGNINALIGQAGQLIGLKKISEKYLKETQSQSINAMDRMRTKAITKIESRDKFYEYLKENKNLSTSLGKFQDLPEALQRKIFDAEKRAK